MIAERTRTCEGCRHSFEFHGDTFCTHEFTAHVLAANNRAEAKSANDCGPAGRYWEPREKGDE